MCYFLYGGINSGVNKKDCEEILNNGHFSFTECTESEIKQGINTCDSKYRITQNMCDCDTALGRHEADNKEISDLSACIHQLQKARGVKHVFVSKNWWKDKSAKECVVHIDDVDIVQFLADIECNCLYKVQLFTKHY